MGNKLESNIESLNSAFGLAPRQAEPVAGASKKPSLVTVICASKSLGVLLGKFLMLARQDYTNIDIELCVDVTGLGGRMSDIRVWKLRKALEKYGASQLVRYCTRPWGGRKYRGALLILPEDVELEPDHISSIMSAKKSNATYKKEYRPIGEPPEMRISSFILGYKEYADVRTAAGISPSDPMTRENENRFVETYIQGEALVELSKNANNALLTNEKGLGAALVYDKRNVFKPNS